MFTKFGHQPYVGESLTLIPILAIASSLDHMHHEPLLIGQAHEHMLIGHAREHMLV